MPETAIRPRITMIPSEPVFGLDSVVVLLEEVLLAAVVVFAAVVVLAVVVLAVVVLAVVLVVEEVLEDSVVVVEVSLSEFVSSVTEVVSEDSFEPLSKSSLAVVSEEVVVTASVSF